MENLLTLVLYGSLLVHILLIAVCVWRISRGENVVDRLIGADLMATLITAVLVLVALSSGERIYIDVALGLTAMGFVAMISLARYIADQQMF